MNYDDPFLPVLTGCLNVKQLLKCQTGMPTIFSFTELAPRVEKSFSSAYDAAEPQTDLRLFNLLPLVCHPSAVLSDKNLCFSAVMTPSQCPFLLPVYLIGYFPFQCFVNT